MRQNTDKTASIFLELNRLTLVHINNHAPWTHRTTRLPGNAVVNTVNNYVLINIITA